MAEVKSKEAGAIAYREATPAEDSGDDPLLCVWSFGVAEDVDCVLCDCELCGCALC